MQIKSKSEQFCHRILGSKIRRSRATCNLIMALASCDEARSPTELSISPLYHYHYSSIDKVLNDLSKDDIGFKSVQSWIQNHCFGYFLDEWGGSPNRIVFQTDTTPMVKAHSPTLAERSYIPVPNTVIKGNKPISIGYDVSFVNVSGGAGKWSLPLSVERVGTEETATEKALGQLEQLLNHPDLGLSEKLCINTADSKYGKAAYFAPSFTYENLVGVVRMKGGNKVWSLGPKKNTGGANGIYGEKFYLIKQSDVKSYKRHPKTGLPYEVSRRTVFDKEADEQFELTGQTAKGREIRISLSRWNNMMIRTANGHNMKDKPLDLLNVQIRDAKTNKAIFKREMFIGISGQRKSEVGTEQAYADYRHRYDIEPYFRFAKQKLMLGSFQTPVLQHLDNWLLIHQMTAWLLYTASDEAEFRPREWRRYLPKNKEVHNQTWLSISQTRRAAQNLFLTFDSEPFKPRKSKKGKPRQKGQTQTKRKTYPVVKKTTRKEKIKLKTEMIV